MSSSNPFRIKSAWFNSSLVWLVNRAIVKHPAFLADSTPDGESSTATQSSGIAPKASAALRKGSGAGLPLTTSSAQIMTFGNVKPDASKLVVATALGPLVAIDQQSGPNFDKKS